MPLTEVGPLLVKESEAVRPRTPTIIVASPPAEFQPLLNPCQRRGVGKTGICRVNGMAPADSQVWMVIHQVQVHPNG